MRAVHKVVALGRRCALPQAAWLDLRKTQPPSPLLGPCQEALPTKHCDHTVLTFKQSGADTRPSSTAPVNWGIEGCIGAGLALPEPSRLVGTSWADCAQGGCGSGQAIAGNAHCRRIEAQAVASRGDTFMHDRLSTNEQH